MRISRRRVAALAGLGIVALLAYSVTVTKAGFYHPDNGATRRVVSLSLHFADTWSIKLLTLRDTVVSTKVSDYLVGPNLPRSADQGWLGTGATYRRLFDEVIACGYMPLVILDPVYEHFQTIYRPFLSDVQYRGLLRLSLSREHYKGGTDPLDDGLIAALERAQTSEAKRALLKERLGQLWQEFLGATQP